MSFPSGWTQRIGIKILHANIGSDLTNFPVGIDSTVVPSMADSLGSPALSGGGDIRASLNLDGTSPLPVEIVKCIPASGAPVGSLEFYVKIPSALHASDTTFYLWWGNSSAIQPIATDPLGKYAVWDSNYMAVYHLSNTNDSTQNQFNLTPSGGPSPTFGFAFQNSGYGPTSNNPWDLLYDVGNTPYSGTQNGTIEAWAQGNVTHDNRIARTGIHTDQFVTRCINLGAEGYVNANPNIHYLNGIGNWAYLSCKYDGANTTVDYGSSGPFAYSTGSFPQTGVFATDDGIQISVNNSSFFLQGAADEVRYSLNTRSYDWTYASWFNQSQPTNFFSTFSTPPIVGSNPPTLFSPANEAGNISIIPTLTVIDNNSPPSDSFDFQIATDIGFSGIVYSAIAVANNNSVPLGTLSEKTVYFWRARALVGATYSDYSSVFTFTTTTLNLISPANHAVLENNLTPLLTWSQFTGASDYNIQLSLYADMSAPIVDATQPAATQNYQVTSSLSVGPKYYWRVRPLVASIPQAFTDIWDFTISPSTLTNDKSRPQFVNTAPLSSPKGSQAWDAYFQNITATLNWNPKTNGITYLGGPAKITGTGFRLSSMVFFSIDISGASFTGSAATAQVILPINAYANGFAMVFDGDTGWKIGDAFIPIGSNICYLPNFVSSTHLAIVGQYQIVATPGT